MSWAIHLITFTALVALACWLHWRSSRRSFRRHVDGLDIPPLTVTITANTERFEAAMRATSEALRQIKNPPPPPLRFVDAILEREGEA